MIDISSGRPPLSAGLFVEAEGGLNSEEKALFGQILPASVPAKVSFFPSRGADDGSCR